MLKRSIRSLILIVNLIFGLSASSQIFPATETKDRLPEIIEKIDQDIPFRKSLQIAQPLLLKQFYQSNNYMSEWFSSSADSSRRDNLYKLLSEKNQFMIEGDVVHFGFIRSVNQNEIILSAFEDTLKAELKFTDAALAFFSDIAYGKKQPFLKYNGLNYKPDCFDISSKLLIGLRTNDFVGQAESLEPQSAKYGKLKDSYFLLDSIEHRENFHEIKVHSKSVTLTNKNLVAKLVQMGYLGISDTTKEQLIEAVNKLQKQHNLPVQPVINNSCLNVLNETLGKKKEELLWNIRWYRWLSCMSDKSYVLVNLPSNHLTYVEDGVVRLESRMVVGKISTPSPTLTSEIKNVIYYPYWNIPYSIATKEILPELKKDPSYLSNLKIEVLQGGKIIDGAAIDWNAYSRGNFPFELRQTPGCHNALGRLKFEFNNPYHVYLHDTNVKSAFLSNKRFFSHGCLRVEKPFDLAIALGVPAEKIDGDTCLTVRKPEVFPLTNPVPVFVIYSTVDVIDGELTWYEDAYKYMLRNK